MRYAYDRFIISACPVPATAKNAGAVFSLKYHVAWCPKYRRPVLVPPVDGRLKALLADIAGERGLTIHATEVMPDHVHLFVEADPTLWGRSYFAASVGAVSEATIRRYIESQKGR